MLFAKDGGLTPTVVVRASTIGADRYGQRWRRQRQRTASKFASQGCELSQDSDVVPTTIQGCQFVEQFHGIYGYVALCCPRVCVSDGLVEQITTACGDFQLHDKLDVSPTSKL